MEALTQATSFGFEVRDTGRGAQCGMRVAAKPEHLEATVQCLLNNRELQGGLDAKKPIVEAQELDSETTCIGDSSNGDSTYRGFVTFDLSGLPDQLQELSAAQLSMIIHTIRGTPFTALGTLVAEHVRFDSISLAAFESAALGPAIDVSSSATTGAQLIVDVHSPVQDDLPARGRSQFRFRFTTLTDSNGAGDLIETDWPTEQLAVTYLIP